jgi:hypothetical protein
MRKSIIIFSLVCVVLNGIIVSGSFEPSSTPARFSQAVNAPSAVRGLSSAVSIPVDILKSVVGNDALLGSVLKCAPNWDTNGRSPLSLINGFSNFKFSHNIVSRGTVVSVLSSFCQFLLEKNIMKVHWPPGGIGGFVYLLLLALLVLLSRKSSMPWAVFCAIRINRSPFP